MTTHQCDICKQKVDKLVKIYDQWKVDDISEICEKCEKEINSVLDATIKAQQIQRHNFVRRFIKSMFK